MQTQTKLTTGLAVFGLLGWFLLWAKSTTPPVTVEKIVTQEVVKYVDRAVDRNVVVTETKPDGTRVVTVDISKERTLETEKSKQKESIITRPVLSKYSLGVSVTPHLTLADFRPTFDYGVEVGARLWSSPAWVTLAYNTQHELSLGLKYEF